MKTKYDGLEIAIIGVAGQFPGSDDCREFWNNLASGREMMTSFSDEELRQRGVSENELQNPLFIKSEGVLNNKDRFDHSFFDYSPDEALLMDPQSRLFHQVCWQALEDAGYSSLIDSQKIGLFAGAAQNDNWKVFVYTKSKEITIDPFLLSKISQASYLTTLVSHKLNLRGPSVFVDTACSTSLAAVHLACRSLLTKECTVALAGGITMHTVKRKGYMYGEGGILSADGHCKAFDASATGTTTGEGVGVVVLKRLAEAIKDKDNIYAIIRSTCVNNDGNLKVGYTAPSVQGQVDCIKMALKFAGISPATISYVEAHGTGTKLGDVIEIQSLNQAYNNNSEKHCAIGSVKTNIGHLDIAAGVAGLIKTVLCLQHRQLAPSLHFTTPNPEIDFEGGPFYVNANLNEWRPTGDYPLRAGVSSFGIGGTNVHAVLEEAPAREAEPEISGPKLLLLSAKTENGVRRYSGNLRHFLDNTPGINLSDMAYTSQVGRKHFTYRRLIVFNDRQDLLNQLGKIEVPGEIRKSRERNHTVVFMFSGQGSQYTGMGKELYQEEALFRDQMDKGFAILREKTGLDAKEILFPASGEDGRIHSTNYTQPLIFIFEYALARLLMSYGIQPRYCIGHSIGEYVAACVGGVFSFEDGLKLVVKRGELMASLAAGSMLSLSLSERAAREFVSEDISLAAVNAPEQSVLSGTTEAIENLMSRLTSSGVPFVKLKTSHAFHSAMQDTIMEAFKKACQEVTFNKTQIPFISNLSGSFITNEEAVSAEYWAAHMRHAVRFSDGIKTLLAQPGEKYFLELGPGQTLAGLALQHAGEEDTLTCFNVVKRAREAKADAQHLAECIGKLWLRGINVDWNSFQNHKKRHKVSFPVYSFEPSRHPTEVDPFESVPFEHAEGIAGKDGAELKDWLYFPKWKSAALYSPSGVDKPHTYLLFSKHGEFTEKFTTELLRQPGNRVIRVMQGGTFAELSENTYMVNPESPDSLSDLFSGLQSFLAEITDVLYAWGIEADNDTLELSPENMVLRDVFFNLAGIIKKLSVLGALYNKRVTVITNALHKVVGNEKVHYSQALLLGLVNVIPQEYSVKCFNVDVNLDERREDLYKTLVRELKNSDPVTNVCAIRYGERWIQDYQRNMLACNVAATSVRREGVYIITGGLGNVGFILAHHLINTYNANVILLGRKDLNKKTPSSGKSSERLDALKALGGSVKYFQADMSSVTSLEEVVGLVEQEFGQINGVIHAAGIIDWNKYELIEDITFNKACEVFEAKISGVENLHKVFKDRSPDFVWITSSLSAVLGGLTFSAYASANLYMDHYILSLSSTRSNWRCVRLGEMVFNSEEVKLENTGKRRALIPKEIAELFEWSLTLENTPVIVETIESLGSRRKNTFKERKEDEVSATNETKMAAAEKKDRPDLDNEPVSPSTPTEKRLVEMYEEFFGMANIGIDDDFFQLGGDSLRGMVVLRKIRSEFNIDLSLAVFFERPFIRAIAVEIDKEKAPEKLAKT